MLSYLSSAASMLPLAAIAGAIAYLPLYLRRRNRAPKMHPLRGLLGYLLCAYAAMVLLVVFFWRAGLPRQMPNFVPFMDIIGAYASGGSLLSSQFMLNIALFLPLGLLLPLVFPLSVNRAYKAVLIALCATLLIELTQYFLGRAADIDDVIANTLGGAAGFAVFVLLRRVFADTLWGGKIFLGAPPPARGSVVASASLLVALALLPVALDAAEQNSAYGLARYCAIRLPRTLAIGIPLSDATPERMVYKLRAAEPEKAAASILSAFRLEGEYSERRAGERLYVNHRDWFLIAEGEGNWSLHVPDGLRLGTFLDAEGMEQEEAAQSVARMFLAEGERIASSVRIPGASETIFQFSVRGGPDYTRGAVGVGLKGDALSFISFNVIRAKAHALARTVPVRDAIRTSTLYGQYDAQFGEAALTSVTEDYVLRGDWVLPAYRLGGTAVRDGETIRWESLVDAVRR